MFNFLKRILGFIKNNPPILYSLFLIIILPLILWGHTLFVIKSFEKNIDFILQEKALTIENIFGHFLIERYQDTEFLQKQIEKISAQTLEIKDLKIITRKNDRFKIIASQKKEEVGKIIKEDSLSWSWDREQNIAHLVGVKKERLWEIVKVFKNEEGKKVFLVTLRFSLETTDRLIARTVLISYFFVFIGILLILFLVFQHTQLFQYLKLYQELRKTEEIKDTFFRMAIHELQSPITNIRGYVETIKDDLREKIPSQNLEDLRRISLSAKSLSELIDDILKVVKIEKQILDITSQEISPTKNMEEVISSFRPQINSKGLKLKYKKGQEKWIIRVNPFRFREILTNLLDNAIKYTISGEIEIEEWIKSSEKKYYFFIKDTGIGISGEEQKKIFQKFYRVKIRETADIPGTGLGLWIVKNLCERMGGSLSLESIKGTGTKFTLSFPLFFS